MLGTILLLRSVRLAIKPCYGNRVARTCRIDQGRNTQSGVALSIADEGGDPAVARERCIRTKRSFTP